MNICDWCFNCIIVLNFSPSAFKRDGKEKAKYVNKDEKIKSYMLSQILLKNCWDPKSQWGTLSDYLSGFKFIVNFMDLENIQKNKEQKCFQWVMILMELTHLESWSILISCLNMIQCKKIKLKKSLSLTVDLLQAFALVGSFQCLFEKPIELCELNLHQKM